MLSDITTNNYCPAGKIIIYSPPKFNTYTPVALVLS